jgi:beta-lactamase regulating signal transducer with metallopeptidase domain
MNSLLTLLDQPLLRRLGWTLVHSVWQSALAAVVLAVMLALFKRSSIRYLISCFMLLLCLTCAVVTYVVLGATPAAASDIRQTAFLTQPVVDITAGHPVEAVQPQRSVDPQRASLPTAALVWLAGVLLLCVRHVGGWIAVQHLRQHARTIDTNSAFARLCMRLRIRSLVRFAESARVHAPSVIGWLKPVVIVPCGALTGLSPAHLEALLAHELAHIRRHDYLVNLIQIAVETLLFYHPAVWWISRQIRQEREHCCDDLAIAVTGSRRNYVEALAAMESLRMSGSSLALASNGGSLLQRVRRLVAPQTQRGSVLWPALLMLGVVFTVVACNQAMSPQVKAQEASPATEPNAQIAVDPIQPSITPAAPAPRAPAKKGYTPSNAAANSPFLYRLYTDAQLAKQDAESQAQIQALEAQLADAQRQFQQQHPKVREAQAQLEAARARYADAKARWDVAATRPEPTSYYISGVQNSGPVPIGHGETVALPEALKAAGITPAQGMYVVIVRQRPRETGARVELLQGNEIADETRKIAPISGGDVIMITDKPTPELRAEALGPHVMIEGNVPHAGPIPWHSGMTLLQAVVASGVNPLGSDQTVVVQHAGRPTENARVSELIGAAGKRDLTPGDKIVIGNEAPAVNDK